MAKKRRLASSRQRSNPPNALHAALFSYCYLLALLLPYGLSYGASTAGEAVRLPICSTYGISWVKADSLGAKAMPAPASPPTPANEHFCGACVMAQSHAGADIPAFAVLTGDQTRLHTPAPYPSEVACSGRRHDRPYRSRAPPARS